MSDVLLLLVILFAVWLYWGSPDIDDLVRERIACHCTCQEVRK